jgi:SAM-dependent methyltransferase
VFVDAATYSVPPAYGSWDLTYDRLAALEGDYTPLQIDAMELKPHHSVLDIGAGSGRLSLPLAERVRNVTALDRSAELLHRLRHRAALEGLDNIRTFQTDWDDVVPGKDLRKHDVVIASRVSSAEDLLKLDQMANEFVYVLMFAGPSTMSLYRALTDGIVAAPEEAHVAQSGVSATFNELCELGIQPNVLHVDDGFSSWYANHDEAVADFDWLGLDDAAYPLLSRNIRRFLREEERGVRFLFPTRSALIWWRK